MPALSTAAKNTMLNALSIASLSLHSAYSATGATEAAGGTPPYARLAATFAGAVAGSLSLIGTPLTFNVPIGTFAWVGLWDGSAAFQGMLPIGSDTPRPFAADDISSDILKAPAHGYLANDTLVVWGGAAAVLPSGLVEGTVYYVVSPTTDTLQLAATLGGSALSLSVTGLGYLQRILPQVLAAQGTYVLNALTIDATVAT